MNAAFEQTVLAYLDGLLDRRAERAFLREVSRDPEKQAVLEQYRTLNSTLQNRSEPVAVPLKTQQALAERIPVLQEVVPKVAPTVAAGGGAGGSGAASFFSRKIVTLLVGGGIMVGTLTAVFVTDPFSPENDTAHHTGLSADSQTDALQNSPAQSAAAASGSAMSAQDAAPVSSANATRTQSADDVSVLPTGRARAERPARKTEVRSAAVTATDADSAPSIAAAAQPPASVSSSESTRERIIGSVHALPLREIPLSQGSPVDGHRFPDHHPFLGFRDILDGRLYAYIESGAAQQQMRGSGNLSKDVLRGVYLAGLRYDFSRHFAGGIEVGQSIFAREGLAATREQLPQTNGSEIFIIDRSLQDEVQPWLRLHGLFTFNPGDRLQFQADAGSGLLLGSSREFIYSLGLSTVYPLTYGLHARAGIHYSGAWLNGSDAQPEITPSSSGVIGIIRRANETGTVYTSTFEFRIGFGVLLW
ncbi:MAG: hypothetical protein KFH87_09130 [Bacteroidetes bacterium]|nr:hypothetical protein [Bacteroidota bacterium]